MKHLKLNFKFLFDALINEKYVAIKLDYQFPEYTKGQDIDIFCRDIVAVTDIIVSFLSEYVNSGFDVRITKAYNQVHVDLMENNKIHFRFDLLSALPAYKTINVKASLFDIIIETYEKKYINNFYVKVPNLIDEAVLRYIEYLEYISTRPDKIKHLDFILHNINRSKENQVLFFEKFHHFLSFPEARPHNKRALQKLTDEIKLIKELTSSAYYLYRQQGLKFLILKIISKIK